MPFSPELLLAVLGVIATGWGISRSGAVAGWKSVAEARKERIGEIEAAHARAEEREAALVKQITELEAQQGNKAVIERLDGVINRVDSLREAVDEIAARWG